MKYSDDHVMVWGCIVYGSVGNLILISVVIIMEIIIIIITIIKLIIINLWIGLQENGLKWHFQESYHFK
jgi:hypothetical protein